MYHIVWIPKYRYAVLVKGVDEDLLVKLDEVGKQYPELEYVERNVQADHVHLVMGFPPRYSIAKVVQILKANTSRALREKFPFLRERYHGGQGIWSVGYFVSTVGLDEARIKRYVRHQEKEDLGQTKFAFI